MGWLNGNLPPKNVLNVTFLDDNNAATTDVPAQQPVLTLSANSCPSRSTSEGRERKQKQTFNAKHTRVLILMIPTLVLRGQHEDQGQSAYFLAVFIASGVYP
jgi:hypothetical protein